jgi:hypothetical protein
MQKMTRFITPTLLLMTFLAHPVRAGGLEDLAWLAGHWATGDGAAEEVWLAPRGGTMTGSFRWVFPDGRQVLEYLVIEERDGQATLRFKHFGTDYVPWEKDAPNEYRLEHAEDGLAEFARLSERDTIPLRMVYRREGDRLHFRATGEDGEEPLEIEFLRR